MYEVKAATFSAALSQLVVQFREKNAGIDRYRMMMDDGAVVELKMGAPLRAAKKRRERKPV
jgi:hypothetical protein